MNTPTKLMYRGTTYNYVGTSPPENPRVGDVYYDGTGVRIYDAGKTTWVTTGVTISDTILDTMYYPTSPKIKYPKNCINCGAILHSYKCEYCDTEY